MCLMRPVLLYLNMHVLKMFYEQINEGMNEAHRILSSFLCYQGSFVGLCVLDYKSLCAAFTICATIINIQTHIQTDRQHFDQLI